MTQKRASAALPIISGILLIAVIALLVWIVVDQPTGGQTENPTQSGTRDSQPPTEQTFADVYALYVEADSNDIRVTASEDEYVHVRCPAEVSAETKYDAQAGTLEVYIQSLPFRWFSFGWGDRDDTVEIAVPALYLIELNSGSGNIDIAQIETGSIYVTAGSGSIDAGRIEASSYIALESGSGNVTCVGFYTESIAAASKSGNIRLEQAYAGEISLNSVSGSQVLRAEMGAVAYFYTSSGNVDIEGREPIEGWARTTSGNVTVRMPFDPQTVAFSTGTGDALFDRGVIREANDPVYEGQMIYEIERGGPTMEVYTESGNLILR